MSLSRKCQIFKATDNQFYMQLGNFEYAEDPQDCTTYGPTKTADEMEKFLFDNFSNPGSISFDDSGTIPTPKNAKPARTTSMWAF